LLRDHQYVLFDGATYTHDSAQPLDRCVFNTLAVPSGTWSPR